MQLFHIGILIEHAEYTKQYVQAGINVYGSDETQTSLETITGERIKAIQPLKKLRLGNFTLIPFEVPHDSDLTCYGYLIKHEDIGKLLFLTDLMFCPYNFKKQKINHMLIEANYMNELVDKSNPNITHVLKGHCELNTSLDIVKANYTNSLRNVIFCHLSKKNCDDEEVLKQAEKVANCPIYVAKKGMQIELSLPF